MTHCYRTVSTAAAGVLVGLPLPHLLARERETVRKKRTENPYCELVILAGEARAGALVRGDGDGEMDKVDSPVGGKMD